VDARILEPSPVGCLGNSTVEAIKLARYSKHSLLALIMTDFARSALYFRHDSLQKTFTFHHHPVAIANPI
jgi:hypothetical protein